MTERLISCAIIRDGNIESRGFKEHWKIRAALGDVDPYKSTRVDDVNGFITSTGRFLTREEAKLVAEDAGQTRPMSRELLSSDIDW